MVEEFHIAVAEKSKLVRDELFRQVDISAKFVAAHRFLTEYELYGLKTPVMPGDILRKQSLLDLQRSLHNVCSGHYVSAFVFQRMYFEKYLFYIQLSSNEFSYGLWRSGLLDMSWALITDDNKGIFSANFCKAFEGLSENRLLYLDMAKVVYRECSEFVHGNYSRISSIDSNLVFDKGTVSEYLSRLEIMHDVCIFAWCNRFLNSPNFPKTELADTIVERMGHLPAVRALLGNQ